MAISPGLERVKPVHDGGSIKQAWRRVLPGLQPGIQERAFASVSPRSLSNRVPGAQFDRAILGAGASPSMRSRVGSFDATLDARVKPVHDGGGIEQAWRRVVPGLEPGIQEPSFRGCVRTA